MIDTDTPVTADGTRPGGVRLLSAMGRHWLIVLLALLHGIALGLVATTLQGVTYASTTQVLMEDPRADGIFRSVPGGDTTQRLASHARRITSDAVLADAIETAGSTLAVEQLRDRVSVSTSPATNVLSIEVVDEGRQNAADLANAVATAFEADYDARVASDAQAKADVLQDELVAEQERAAALQAQISEQVAAAVPVDATLAESEAAVDPILRSELSSTLGMIESIQRAQSELLVDATVRSEIEEIQPAEPAPAPLTPTPERNLAFGAILGLLAGATLAWWWEEKRPSADRAADPATVLAAPLLGSVAAPEPGALLARRRDAARWAGLVGELSFGLTQQGSTMVSVVAPTMSEPSAQVAANLAAAASRQGWRVLLVDADLGESALTAQLQSRPTVGLADVAAGRAQRPDKTAVTVPGAGFRFVGVGVRRPGDLPRPELATEVKRVIHEAIGDENLVIVATAPISTGTESAAVVSSLDGTIAVIPRGTPLPLVENMRMKFTAAATAVLGYVYVARPAWWRRILRWGRPAGVARHQPTTTATSGQGQESLT